VRDQTPADYLTAGLRRKELADDSLAGHGQCSATLGLRAVGIEIPSTPTRQPSLSFHLPNKHFTISKTSLYDPTQDKTNDLAPIHQSPNQTHLSSNQHSPHTRPSRWMTGNLLPRSEARLVEQAAPSEKPLCEERPL